MSAVSTSKGLTTRDRLLDGAETVVIQLGASALTLDAVATAAGVSKGGLLYHFPSKDHLARALVERAVQRVDTALEEASTTGMPGAFTRAYINITMGDGSQQAEGDPLSSALLGALAVDPTLLDPLRQAYARWQSRLEDDGIDPVDATLVRLAVDGWWTSLVLGLQPLPRSVAAKIRHRLTSLTT